MKYYDMIMKRRERERDSLTIDINKDYIYVERKSFLNWTKSDIYTMSLTLV